MRTTAKDPLKELMGTNFIEYASYVIKDRAIPHVDDGLKPVQRRILHSLKEVDDGKFHKVANIVGHTMKYHPHGDLSIYSALVALANKNLFIDTQGNFGNELTGDPPSAPRYIECRLTALAKEVLFNNEITVMEESYDARNKEPALFPCKIPTLLIQGAEGIAVGLSTKVLPHNFVEVLKAQIAILKKKDFKLLPDFSQGGVIDASQYDKGRGKIKIRAKIDIMSPKILVIRELPFQITVDSLIQSIEDATKKNKIKVSSINDYTSDKVEIEVVLQRGAEAKKTLDALYAFTNCETSMNLDLCVIQENRPVRLTVDELLEHATRRLKYILKTELELKLEQLNQKKHVLTLERIFIEKRLYKFIEDCSTMEEVRKTIVKSLKKYKKDLAKEITDPDIDHLLSIPIRRISLYDINKNKKDIDEVVLNIKDVQKKLKNMVQFTIKWIENILKKYGQERERKTKITSFQSVDVRTVASRSFKLGYDKKTKYLGTNIATPDAIQCSSYDRILIINKKGKFKVINVPEKIYIPETICYFAIYDENPVYSVIYREKKSGYLYAKKFKIDKYILDKEYEYFKEDDKFEFISLDKDLRLNIEFQHEPRKKIKEMSFDFSTLATQNYKVRGTRIANRAVKTIKKIKTPQKEETLL